MPEENKTAREADRTDHPANITSDPQSTWGANEEDKAAWQKKFGKDKDKKDNR